MDGARFFSGRTTIEKAITMAGQVVGAVAAGGATREQDVIVAKAALAALGLPD